MSFDLRAVSIHMPRSPLASSPLVCIVSCYLMSFCIAYLATTSFLASSGDIGRCCALKRALYFLCDCIAIYTKKIPITAIWHFSWTMLWSNWRKSISSYLNCLSCHLCLVRNTAQHLAYRYNQWADELFHTHKYVLRKHTLYPPLRIARKHCRRTAPNVIVNISYDRLAPDF